MSRCSMHIPLSATGAYQERRSSLSHLLSSAALLAVFLAFRESFVDRGLHHPFSERSPG